MRQFQPPVDAVITRLCLSVVLGIVLSPELSCVIACKPRTRAVARPMPVKIEVNFNTFVKCENETEIELAGCLNGQCMVYAEVSPNNVIVKRYSTFVKCYCSDEYEGRWCGEYRLPIVEQRAAMVAGLIFCFLLLLAAMLVGFVIYHYCRQISRDRTTSDSHVQEELLNCKTEASTLQNSRVLHENTESQCHNSFTQQFARSPSAKNLQNDTCDTTSEKKKNVLLLKQSDVHLFIDEDEDDRC